VFEEINEPEHRQDEAAGWPGSTSTFFPGDQPGDPDQDLSASVTSKPQRVQTTNVFQTIVIWPSHKWLQTQCRVHVSHVKLVQVNGQAA